MKWDNDRKTAVNHDESIIEWAFHLILQVVDIVRYFTGCTLFALEDGSKSVCRLEYKQFMAAALSTLKPSLTTKQLEKIKLIQK